MEHIVEHITSQHASMAETIALFRTYARSQAEVERMAAELANWFRIIAPNGYTAWRIGPDTCIIRQENTAL